MGILSIFSSFSMIFDFIYYMLIVNKIFEDVSATPVRRNQTNKKLNQVQFKSFKSI